MDVKKRIDQMPSSFRLSYEKSRKSKAFAIKSMCAECSGYERKVIGECTDVGCPLWPHRPYQKKGAIEEEETEEEETEEEETEEEEEDIEEVPLACEHANVKKGDGFKECMDCGKRWKKKQKEEANVAI